MSFLVDREVQGLFEDEGDADFSVASSCWPQAKYGKVVFNRLLRILHFNCFILAGIVSPAQNVVWISDQDEIASNENQLRALTSMFASGCTFCHSINTSE